MKSFLINSMGAVPSSCIWHGARLFLMTHSLWHSLCERGPTEKKTFCSVHMVRRVSGALSSRLNLFYVMSKGLLRTVTKFHFFYLPFKGKFGTNWVQTGYKVGTKWVQSYDISYLPPCLLLRLFRTAAMEAQVRWVLFFWMIFLVLSSFAFIFTIQFLWCILLIVYKSLHLYKFLFLISSNCFIVYPRSFKF